jgi:hypothetical protein
VPVWLSGNEKINENLKDPVSQGRCYDFENRFAKKFEKKLALFHPKYY